MNAKADTRNRAYWLKTLHQWHWISSAACLVGLLLFSITGITLNHASQIEARPRVDTRELQLPEPVLSELLAQAKLAAEAGAGKTANASRAGSSDRGGQAEAPARSLPEAVARWITNELAVDVRGREIEWSADEVYVALPRPGGDAWLRIGLPDGELTYERTDRGWVSYFNDLHKGRHTGVAWSWFIDVFAVACLVFAITGFFILKMHAQNRPSTWPLVGFGIALPALLAILFIH